MGLGASRSAAISARTRSWARGQGKGQTRQQAPAQGTVPRQAGGGDAALLLAQPAQAHLMGDQFLEGQAQKGRVAALQQVVQVRRRAAGGGDRRWPRPGPAGPAGS